MFSAYSYVASPDGEDVLEKLIVVGNRATVLGLALANIDFMTSKISRTYLEILGRYAYITFPVIGVATAFVVTSNIAGRLRHKSDKYNWIAGGIASGMILGKVKGSIPLGFFSGAAFAFAGGIAKHCWDRGIIFFPVLHNDSFTHHMGLRLVTDYSYTKERPREWKKSIDE